MTQFKLPQLIVNKNMIQIYLFLVISIGIFFLMGYQDVAFKGPLSRHAYRQSDSYSFALNYYYENNSFFEPAVLLVLEEKGSKAASEFPLLHFITAKIWKITGVSPFVPRIMNLFILFLGLFYLYKLSYLLLKDHFWALLTSLFLFSSPLLGYYGFNFIPNIPALGFVLIACYYYLRYYTTEKIYYLILSGILFALGALLKVSGLYAFLALNAVLFFQNFNRIKQKPQALLLQLASLFFVFAMVISWHIFAVEYNSTHAGGLFRQGIIPIWNLSSEHIQRILDSTFTNTILYFFNPFALIALAGMFLSSIVYLKKTDKTLLSITAFLFLGLFCFIILFFEGMDAHEYFLIDLTILIPAITLTFLSTLKGLSLNLFNSKIVKSFAFVLLLLALNYNMVTTRSHFNPHNKLVTQNIPLPNRVQEYWNWSYWNWEIKLKKYEGIIPYLRSLGIKFEDRVITVPDETPNLTLTLLNQKGFPDYHYSINYKGSGITERKIELGAKYMIVQGDENLLREDVAPFIQNQIGEYQGIKIYKLTEGN